MLSRTLGQALAGACLCSINLLFISLAASIRQMPAMLKGARRLLRWMLILSFRLYRLILTGADPLLVRLLGVSLLVGPLRVASTTLLSVALASGALLLVGLPVNGWGIGVGAIHGLLVGLAWDEIERPGGLQLGVRLE